MNTFRWFVRLVRVLERIVIIMAQIDADKLVAAVTQFSADFSKFSADFSKFLAAIPAADPATQNKIDTAVAALSGFDTQVQALDSLVSTPVVDPNPTPQP